MISIAVTTLLTLSHMYSMVSEYRYVRLSVKFILKFSLILLQLWLCTVIYTIFLQKLVWQRYCCMFTAQ